MVRLYSPGPWKFTQYHSGTKTIVMRTWSAPEPNYGYPKGWLYANVNVFNKHGAPPGIQVEAYATAKLIEKAPELAEQLERMTCLMETVSNGTKQYYNDYHSKAATMLMDEETEKARRLIEEVNCVQR